MKDWIKLLIAFVLGFVFRHSMKSVCRGPLVEGALVDGSPSPLPPAWLSQTLCVPKVPGPPPAAMNCDKTQSDGGFNRDMSQDIEEFLRNNRKMTVELRKFFKDKEVDADETEIMSMLSDWHTKSERLCEANTSCKYNESSEHLKYLKQI